MTLISIGDLITKGFKDIQETWKPTLKYTVWFFLAPILFGVVMLLVMGASFAGLERGSTMPPIGAGIGLIVILGYIGLIIAMLYASIATTKYVLAHAKGQSMASWKPERNPLSYVPSLLWVTLLMVVPLVVSWMLVALPRLALGQGAGAGLMTFLFILGAFAFNVWFCITFSQAGMEVIDDGKRGIEALKASYAMVVDRWWKTLWRLLLPNFLFQACISTAIMVIYMAAFFIGIAVFGGWTASMGLGGEDAARASNIGFGLFGVVLMVVFGLVIFAFTIVASIANVLFQASVASRLFLSLKGTKAK